ncbi:hypothetical protein AMK59_8137 [Oryctes borbonicus]|uniref:Uncharacterized protein n=1 Tax=Oryctes borbonicus TaxID=1629725 RepID=A0A0T6AVK5_9SCAR|nr:hypothetical protein AMK59_8137 [Oryctes borbonicus]
MSQNRIMWLILFLKLFLINEIRGNLANQVQDLSENFLANLEADPFLINNEFSKESVEFINQQTENYITLMKKKYGIKDRGINKRSVQYSEDFGSSEGSYSFQELSPLDLWIAKNASDIFFIQQNNTSYVLVLEKISTNNIMFYKQNGENFDVLFTQSVGAINKIVTYSNSKEIFVILSNFTGIFVHTVSNNNLKFMQKLKLQELSDIIVWENTNGLFLSVVREKENSTYTSTCLIYKWLGRYFDEVNHEITTYGSRSVTAFSVGSLDFMAIANYKDDEGQTGIYSEIFKYNVDTERYEPHQKLFTNGAVDILFFSLKYYGLEEAYLVVANSEKNENHIESIANSIIYKYVGKYFIPFQSIANRTDKWITTSEVQERLFLISLSKSEGVRAFTYDGWKFVAQDIKQLDNFQSGIVYGSFQNYTNNIILSKFGFFNA